MKRIFAILCVLVLSAVSLVAQAPNLTGTWQGTLHVGKGLRVVLHLSPNEQNGWKGELLSIDQGPTPIALSSASLNGDAFSFTVDMLHISYKGTLSADGNAIKGTFNQGGDMPLDFDRATPATEWKIDASPHKVSFATVDKTVKLEVLDWGGTGRPLVLLAGLGGTAHVFDQLAPKLTANFHVIGITRRGFPASSVPEPTETNYSAERLGDDVLEVIHQLKLEKPIVGGHSIAGEELSYIGTQHPDEVAGLIYLDAGYPYAFYDTSRGDLTIDADVLRYKLERAAGITPISEQKKLIDELLTTDLPALQKDLERTKKELTGVPDMPMPGNPDDMKVPLAVLRGETRFGAVKCPALAIFASPHDLGPQGQSMTPEQRKAMEDADIDRTGSQVKAFEQGNPQAKVVVLPHANHAVFFSNEADVLREINAFAATLK